MNRKRVIAAIYVVGSLLSANMYLVAGNTETDKKHEESFKKLDIEFDLFTETKFNENDYDATAQKRYAKTCKNNKFEKCDSTQKNKTKTGKQFLNILKRHYGKQLPDDEKLNELQKAFCHKKFQECVQNMRHTKKCKIASKFDKDSVQLDILWQKKRELQHQRNNAKISDEQFEQKFNLLKKQFRKIPKLPRNFVWTPEQKQQYSYYKKAGWIATGSFGTLVTLVVMALIQQGRTNRQIALQNDINNAEYGQMHQ